MKSFEAPKSSEIGVVHLVWKKIEIKKIIFIIDENHNSIQNAATIKYAKICANRIKYFTISSNTQKSIVFSLFDNLSVTR